MVSARVSDLIAFRIKRKISKLHLIDMNGLESKITSNSLFHTLDVLGFALWAHRDDAESFEWIFTIKTFIFLSKNSLFFANVYQAKARPRTHSFHLLRSLILKIMYAHDEKSFCI